MSDTEIKNMKNRIMDEYKRLGVEDKFCFGCDRNVSCFTACCGDVNIFLTPYDVLRLKNFLKISSSEFLVKYTVSPFTKEQKFPVVLLKMNEENNKRCFFVTEEGCTVYEDRPWPCRMYPVGMAAAECTDGKAGEEFYFIMQEDVCEGLKEKTEWTIKQWVQNQGVDPFTEFGEMYKHLTLHPFFQGGNDLPLDKMDMFYMSLYDLDNFRRFVFDSGFLNRFVVEPGLAEKIKTHDSELLRFAFRWLHFALFGDTTLTVKPEVLERLKEGDKK